MAYLHVVRESDPEPARIEPLGYVALWQAMRGADSALLWHGLRARLPEVSLTQAQKDDLVIAAHLLDPKRSDRQRALTDYGVALPPERLVVDFQSLIDGSDIEFGDELFDAAVRLELTSRTLRQLVEAVDIPPADLLVASHTVNTLMRYAIDQYDAD